LLVFAIIGGAAAAVLPGDYRWWPAAVLAVLYFVPMIRGLASAVINAAMLSRFSTTPGKWLCGIRIVRGAPLSFGKAVTRELDAHGSTAPCSFR
jgi:uncharacterized RDD family membrane protein YckC